MNDCMNWRWKRRNAASSGETAISVPALITAQSTPDSGAPKIARPTVSGRVVTSPISNNCRFDVGVQSA